MAFARGAKPTPRHVLLAATPHQVVQAPPPQYAVVPKQLDMWDNDVDGDCVTAEEAFAKACFSVQNGLPETFVPTTEVVRWAKKYGFLNGAYLPEVMDKMAVDGFSVNGANLKDGPYKGVDYGTESTLQSAITVGPVKIGIDANGLPSGAGNHQGWFSTLKSKHGNEDHCVALCGYGRADYLYSQLGLVLPTALSASLFGYLLFTWSTIGFVTHDWLMGSCQEAWVRNPTTLGVGPTPVPPVPPTPPTPPTPPSPPSPPSPVLPVLDVVYDKSKYSGVLVK